MALYRATLSHITVSALILRSGVIVRAGYILHTATWFSVCGLKIRNDELSDLITPNKRVITPNRRGPRVFMYRGSIDVYFSQAAVRWVLLAPRVRGVGLPPSMHTPHLMGGRHGPTLVWVSASIGHLNVSLQRLHNPSRRALLKALRRCR